LEDLSIDLNRGVCFLLAMKQKAYIPKRWAHQASEPEPTENTKEEEEDRIEIIAFLKEAIEKETKISNTKIR
jgi:hypothetical protein